MGPIPPVAAKPTGMAPGLPEIAGGGGDDDDDAAVPDPALAGITSGPSGPLICETVPWERVYTPELGGWIPIGFAANRLAVDFVVPVYLTATGGSARTRTRLLGRCKAAYWGLGGRGVWRQCRKQWWASWYSVLLQAEFLPTGATVRWALAEDSRRPVLDRVLDYQVGPDNHIWIRPNEAGGAALGHWDFNPGRDLNRRHGRHR